MPPKPGRKGPALDTPLRWDWEQALIPIPDPYESRRVHPYAYVTLGSAAMHHCTTPLPAHPHLCCQVVDTHLGDGLVEETTACNSALSGRYQPLCPISCLINCLCDHSWHASLAVKWVRKRPSVWTDGVGSRAQNSSTAWAWWTWLGYFKENRCHFSSWKPRDSSGSLELFSSLHSSPLLHQLCLQDNKSAFS